MADSDRVLLIQLPLHPCTAWEPTGNIPLAPARLAAAAGLCRESVFPEYLQDSMGDRELLRELSRRKPALLGVTLYLWNRERTLHLLRRLKQLDPSVMVVAGGPEVTADNTSLLEEGCIDLFVAGEGEPHAKTVLCPVSARRLVESGHRLLGPAVETAPPDRWPDPYETGHIEPVPGGAAHVETQRGCGCLCSYCAYRRASPVARTTPAEKVLKKLRRLKDKGAGELVFLDPTFNARPDLDGLLAGMAGLNMRCFGEARGDLLSGSGTASALRTAGFHSIEVGLQTINERVLLDVGRGGSPIAILRGARMLHEAGVTPVIDLILGLPGDSPESIVSAAGKIVELGLEEQVQTFLLSVLPGTELKRNAESLGIEFLKQPPYCVTRSGRHTLPKLLEAREQVSDILGYDADPPSRPVLCDDFPGMELFRPERPMEAEPPSVRHGVLRIVSNDPWLHRNAIMERVSLRRRTDPYCPLDVVIECPGQFPLNLLDILGGLAEPVCYETGKASLFGVPPLLRRAVIVGGEADQGWLMECCRSAVTVVKRHGPSALPGGETGLLIMGKHDLSVLSAMYSSAPHLVFFCDMEMERLWNLDVLGLG